MKPLGKYSRKRNTAALTLIEVMVAIAVIIILAGLFLPSLARKNRKSSRIICVSNLKQIGLAFRMWGNDNGDKFPMFVSVTNGGAMELVSVGNVVPFFQVMSNELNDPKILICPMDSGRVAASNWTSYFSAKNCSYFVGLDAGTNQPCALLAGDSNFEIGGVQVKSGLLEFPSNAPISWTATRHKLTGYIALADGSVQQVSSRGLRQLTGLATNRLLLP